MTTITLHGRHGMTSRIYYRHLGEVLVSRQQMDREGVGYGQGSVGQVPRALSVHGQPGQAPESPATETAGSPERAPCPTGRVAYAGRQSHTPEERHQ